MGLPKQKLQNFFFNAAEYDDMGGIPADHWCYRFWTCVTKQIDDSRFSALYHPEGAKPISPGLIVCIMILQYKFGYSDRGAVEATIMRRDWRIALGIEFGWEGFEPSVLCDMRKRLQGLPVREGQKPPTDAEGGLLLFNIVLDLIREAGLLENSGRLRVDATHILAQAARLNRADVVSESTRLLVRDAAKRRPELLEDPQFSSLSEQYGEERWVGTGDGSDEALLKLGKDAQLLLDLCSDMDLAAKDTLVRVVEENFVRETEDDATTVAGVLPADQRPKQPLVSPHEPDVETGKKRNTPFSGDKLHVLETANRLGPNFVLGLAVTGPRMDDISAFPLVLAEARKACPTLSQLLADAGYSSVANGVLARKEGVDLIAPPRGNSSRNGIPRDAFILDLVNQVATCPEGKTSSVWSDGDDGANIRFKAADCNACQRRAECTTSKQGRSLSLTQHHEQLERDRQRAETPEFKDLYRLRAPVEGTFSQLVNGYGLRRSRYKGRSGRHLHSVLAVTALNAWRLVEAAPMVAKPQPRPHSESLTEAR